MQRIVRVITLVFLSISVVAHADETSKRAKVKELFQLTFMEKRVEQTKAAALAQARTFAAQQLAIFNLSKDMDNSAAAYYEKLYTLVATRYDWRKLGPAYEQIYLDLYTEQELDGMLAFYKSPVGQALLSKTPEATSRMLEVSKQQFDQLTPQIQRLTEDYVARLRMDSTAVKKK
jgi:uncharacterized protein